MTCQRARKVLVAGVLAGAGLALAACNDGGTAAPATETVTVAADDQSEESADQSEEPAADDPVVDEAGGRLPAGWPDQDFPLPPGVTVTARESGGHTGIVLVGRSPDEITAFYRTALPAAGYTITKDASVGAGQLSVTGMEFNGNGWDGKIAVVNHTVSISLEKS